MKKWLSIMMAAGLLLYPFATFAADYGSQQSQTQQGPPVAQPLVREGDFAVKLAAQLNLGISTDEIVAEDLLAKAGVAPLNGWLSDYPVTPEIVGQLQDSITAAAADGKLPMNAEEAKKGLSYLATQMSLPTPASNSSVPEGSQAPVAQSNTDVINNYYYDQGPPIITYYPPPYDYAYLYGWVPYPVWWYGVWFPGFFICHNFTTVVVVNSFDRDGHREHWRRGMVSNHVIDPRSGRVAVVDPSFRTGSGMVRPLTTLRTQSGERFRNVTDMRQGVSMSGPNTEKREFSVNSSTHKNEGFSTADARKSARTIYSRSIENMKARGVQEGGMNLGGERRYRAPDATQMNRPFNAPLSGGERRSYASVRSSLYRSPGMNSRGNGSAMSMPRSNSLGGGWHVASSIHPYGRTSNGSGTGEGRASGRSFTGNGWRGR